MELKEVKVSACYESETNPRGTEFGGKTFDELVASIKEKGVLVPILVRPRAKAGKEFEVVAGNRRFRAAQKLKLETIPAKVQEMSDDEAAEAQIVENLQREDVHPLEEGEAYRKLILENDGYDVEAIAAKVGKSKTYVRDRLVMTNLVPSAASEFRKGVFTAGHAALIARLDDQLQKDSLDYIKDESEYSVMPSIGDLREWIQKRQFAISASNPPWKGNEAMTAMVGGCEECKGKGGDLFGKKAADVCPNPVCYANRMTAYIAVQRQKNPGMILVSDYYSSDTSKEAIGTGKYRELVAKKDGCDLSEPGIFVDGLRMGRAVKVCRNPECKKHWGAVKPQGFRKLSEEEKESRRKRKEQEEKEHAKAEKDLQTALARVKWPMTEGQLGALLDIIFEDLDSGVAKRACERRGIEVVVNDNKFMVDYDGPLMKATKQMTNGERLQLAFELLIGEHIFEMDLKKVYKSL